jgi:hypothetical protein
LAQTAMELDGVALDGDRAAGTREAERRQEAEAAREEGKGKRTPLNTRYGRHGMGSGGDRR